MHEIEIDKFKGYALYAKNNDVDNEELYQVVLFKEEGGHYLLLGTDALK